MSLIFSKALNKLATAWGYQDTNHFLDSTFHPNFAIEAAAVSSTLAGVAYYFDKVFGFQLPVALGIIILMFMEMRTGIKAAKMDPDVGWESDKFQKGWLKFAIYWTLIGVLNIFDTYAKNPRFFAFEIDIWAFAHFAWYNFVIIQLLGSNIENFIKLGWDKNHLLIRFLKKLYDIKIKSINDHDRTN